MTMHLQQSEAINNGDRVQISWQHQLNYPNAQGVVHQCVFEKRMRHLYGYTTRAWREGDIL